jgi:hypothetical protein
MYEECVPLTDSDLQVLEFSNSVFEACASGNGIGGDLAAPSGGSTD